MRSSYCGLVCGECGFRAETDCPGCIASEGKMFWGECPVARCAIGKSHGHCGECAEFPCKQLSDYSNDPEHGDKPAGKRIEQCRSWKELEQ